MLRRSRCVLLFLLILLYRSSIVNAAVALELYTYIQVRTYCVGHFSRSTFSFFLLCQNALHGFLATTRYRGASTEQLARVQYFLVFVARPPLRDHFCIMLLSFKPVNLGVLLSSHDRLIFYQVSCHAYYNYFLAFVCRTATSTGLSISLFLY